MSFVVAYRQISRDGPLLHLVAEEEIRASRGLADDVEPGPWSWGGSFQFPSITAELQAVCETVTLPELVGVAWGSTVIGPKACGAFSKLFADYRKAGNKFPAQIKSQCVAYWRAFWFAKGTGMVRLITRDILRSTIRR